jgi:hypothetical protein
MPGSAYFVVDADVSDKDILSCPNFSSIDEALHHAQWAYGTRIIEVRTIWKNSKKGARK